MPQDWDEMIQQMDRWAQEMDRFFDHLEGAHRAQLAFALPTVIETTAWRPQVNVYEQADAVVVLVEVAGVAPEDLNVEYQAHRLRLSGLRRDDLVDGIKRVDRMEIQFGPFAFEIPLPGPVDPEGAEAKLINGFLQIRLPKRQPQNQMIRVELNENR